SGRGCPDLRAGAAQVGPAAATRTTGRAGRDVPVAAPGVVIAAGHRRGHAGIAAARSERTAGPRAVSRAVPPAPPSVASPGTPVAARPSLASPVAVAPARRGDPAPGPRRAMAAIPRDAAARRAAARGTTSGARAPERAAAGSS